jgi:hypothetical protein
VRKALLFLLAIYKEYVSPLLGESCRYIPTCSHYAAVCIKRHPLPKALYFTFKRLLRCHPFSEGGYDPPPR